MERESATDLILRWPVIGFDLSGQYSIFSPSRGLSPGKRFGVAVNLRVLGPSNRLYETEVVVHLSFRELVELASLLVGLSKDQLFRSGVGKHVIGPIDLEVDKDAKPPFVMAVDDSAGRTRTRLRLEFSEKDAGKLAEAIRNVLDDLEDSGDS